MGAFQKDLSSFERLGTQVLGVSPDDIETHRRFAKELGLTFPLVSDPAGKIASLYGKGRITVLIDRQSVVRHVENGMPDNSRLLKAIQALGP